MGHGCASIDIAQHLTNLSGGHAVAGSLLSVHLHIYQWRGVREGTCYIGEVRSLRNSVKHLLRCLTQRLIVVCLDVNRNGRVIATRALAGKGKGADISQVFELIAYLLLDCVLIGV